MKSQIKRALTAVKEIFYLASLYSKRKVILLFLISLIQGIFNVFGVISIFPFLAVASDPNRILNSKYGAILLNTLNIQDQNQLIICFGILVVISIIISNIVNFFAEHKKAKVIHECGHYLRLILIRKIISMPYQDFIRRSPSLYVKKIVYDVNYFVSYVYSPLLDVIARAILIALLGITMFAVHPTIVLILTTIFCLYYLVFFLYNRNRRRLISEETNQSLRAIYKLANEIITGIKPIIIHSAGEYLISKLADASSKYSRVQPKITYLSNYPKTLIEPLAFGSIIFVVILNFSIQKNITEILPNLGVIALAGYRMLPALQYLYSQLNNLEAHIASLHEIYEEISQCHKTTNTKPITKNVKVADWHKELEIKDLSFTYDRKSPFVFKNLNLKIKKNSMIGIVGPTGCGKSTLLDLILGLLTPTSGQIMVDGMPLHEFGLDRWHSGIGYVPQDIFLLDDTLAANIALGVPSNKINYEDLRCAAEAAQILSFIENLPEKWNTQVGDRGIRLSGGQRQRIGIARALYHKPNMLILDEATSALDVHTESEFMESIRKFQGKLTIIIISHRLNTLLNCDIVFNLDEFKAKQLNLDMKDPHLTTQAHTCT